ncbi:MAG: DUF6122 family protein [Desulfobacterales bacterium]|nr:DUF6122 family protein [Desulfobacterales bacterium]
MLRPAVHLLSHFIVPGAASRWVWADRWKSAWVIMVATIIVDLDHLLADPVYDPNRCGIGFHPLHTFPAIGFYLLMLLIPKIRLVGLGLLIHMALDGADCMWMLLE